MSLTNCGKSCDRTPNSSINTQLSFCWNWLINQVPTSDWLVYRLQCKACSKIAIALSLIQRSNFPSLVGKGENSPPRGGVKGEVTSRLFSITIKDNHQPSIIERSHFYIHKCDRYLINTSNYFIGWKYELFGDSWGCLIPKNFEQIWRNFWENNSVRAIAKGNQKLKRIVNRTSILRGAIAFP